MDNGVIKINTSIGIIGSTSIGVQEEGDSRSIHIKQTGAARHKLIPLVIVVCEDELAKQVIESIMSEERCSFNIVVAGSWVNLTTILYGMLFYRKELLASGDDRFLEVVCVTDGDITEVELNGRIKGTHLGNSISSGASDILFSIREKLVSFSLTELPEYTGGKPELNHKCWLEEITEETIRCYYQKDIGDKEEGLKNSVDAQALNCFKHDLFFINKEIEETLRVIEASKRVQPKTLKEQRPKANGGGIVIKSDYHYYYTALQEELERGDTLMKYSSHRPIYTVITIIKKFNNARWRAYTATVREALLSANERQVALFRQDRFNNTKF